MDNSPIDYLKNLNHKQQEAVINTEGPLLVLAGAGTGKTKVLTNRIAHIISQAKAFASQILSVTFTNKAAKEMNQRIDNLVISEGIWLGTFHSISAKILRKHAPLIGLANNYNIINSDDQARLIKNILNNFAIDDKKFTPKSILNIIQRWKDFGLSIDKLSFNDITSSIEELSYRIYQEYQKRLLAINSVDFGDLLLLNLELFSKHPDILTYYQRKFHYILVDEYQDTNVSQYLWLKMLADLHKNICCVGDEDQSIYGWRGAEIGNILRFEQDFAEAKIIRLEQNYRSTNHILSVASKLIAHNKMRLGKSLWTDSNNGPKVRIISLGDDREEARFIANELLSNKRNYQLALNQMAILVRASFQTRAFEECFINYAIPYKVIGGLRFYERLEIRDIIAYLRVVMNPNDDLALERIINTPKRSIGNATIKVLHQFAQTYNISLFSAINQLIAKGGLKAKIKNILQSLVELFERWRQLFDQLPHPEVVEIILKESNYLAMWQNDKTIEAEGRIENIKELLRAITEFQNIDEFLEHISLISDNEVQDSHNMVNIMTLHAAKGLEFEIVFLPGWEEGIFPHQRSLDENGLVALEEERRLAYVGITRARKTLNISFVSYRRIYNQYQTSVPSRFINELPNENVEKIIGNRTKY